MMSIIVTIRQANNFTGLRNYFRSPFCKQP
jgi:hypothetical protein